MSRFACITRLAYNIAAFVRKRLLKDKTLGAAGQVTLVQVVWKTVKLFKVSAHVTKENVALRRQTKKTLRHLLSKLRMKRHFEKLMCRASFLYFALTLTFSQITLLFPS